MFVRATRSCLLYFLVTHIRYTHCVSNMNKTHQQIKFECIVIVASIDICVYFTSSSVKCIVLLVFVFKHSTVNTYIKRSNYMCVLLTLSYYFLLIRMNSFLTFEVALNKRVC